MKYSISQLFQTFIVLAFFCNYTFSQEKKSFFDGYLWIKGTDNKEKINNLQESELRKQFNFNPIIDFSKDKVLKKYKNLVSKNSSLFLVFKSTSNEENILFSLERGSFKAYLSNQKVVCDKEVLLNKGDSKKGTLVSYLYNKNSLTGRKNGSLIIEDLLFDDKEFKNQLAELIYIPRYVTTNEKAIIESYLSIKYGISLNEGQSYFNSKGDKIWDIEQNEGYNFNITGIGKDKYTGLNQKQAKNSIDDGLTIGLNKVMKSNIENDSQINDRVFLIWGNNGKSVVLEKSTDKNQKSMKRVWKFNTISDSVTKLKTQIKIDKKLMPIETKFDVNDKEFIWLAIDSLSSSSFNYNNAKYIKATINNESEIVFDNIEFYSDVDYLFTIIKAHPSEINSNYISATDLQKKIDEENTMSNQLLIYPNPINANEKFNMQFNLKQSSNVIVQIADVNGKIIKTKNLGSIKNFIFSDNIPVSGTFLILTSIDGRIETNKLIVK
jgi:hypothetical protein